MAEFDRHLSRKAFLLEVAKVFKAETDLSVYGLELDLDAVEVAATLYFALNRSYKIWRIADGHNTQPAKIAALTAVAIMMVRPVFSPTADDTHALLVTNPYLAMTASLSIIGATLEALKPDTIERIARWLDKVRISSSREAVTIIATAKLAGEFLRIEDIALPLTPREVVELDMVVSTFELIERTLDKPIRHEAAVQF